MDLADLTMRAPAPGDVAGLSVAEYRRELH
jgi:hypothetical protein